MLRALGRQAEEKAPEIWVTPKRISPLPPDPFIEVPVDSCGALEFERAEEMIRLGRTCARNALATWQAQSLRAGVPGPQAATDADRRRAVLAGS